MPSNRRNTKGEYFTKRVRRSILTLSVSLLLLTGVAVYGQIYRLLQSGHDMDGDHNPNG